MLADTLFDLSNRGDIVINPFLGSGSTPISERRRRRLPEQMAVTTRRRPRWTAFCKGSKKAERYTANAAPLRDLR